MENLSEVILSETLKGISDKTLLEVKNKKTKKFANSLWDEFSSENMEKTLWYKDGKFSAEMLTESLPIVLSNCREELVPKETKPKALKHKTKKIEVGKLSGKFGLEDILYLWRLDGNTPYGSNPKPKGYDEPKLTGFNQMDEIPVASIADSLKLIYKTEEEIVLEAKRNLKALRNNIELLTALPRKIKRTKQTIKNMQSDIVELSYIVNNPQNIKNTINYYKSLHERQWVTRFTNKNFYVKKVYPYSNTKQDIKEDFYKCLLYLGLDNKPNLNLHRYFIAYQKDLVAIVSTAVLLLESCYTYPNLTLKKFEEMSTGLPYNFYWQTAEVYKNTYDKYTELINELMKNPTRKKKVLLDLTEPVTMEKIKKYSVPDCFGQEFDIRDNSCAKCHDNTTCGIIYRDTVGSKAKKQVDKFVAPPLDTVDFSELDEKKDRIVALLKQKAKTGKNMTIAALVKHIEKISKCGDKEAVHGYFKRLILENGLGTKDGVVIIKS